MTDNDKIKMYLTEIVKLADGWDEHGATAPKNPYTWETVARMSMDYARAALDAAMNGAVDDDSLY